MAVRPVQTILATSANSVLPLPAVGAVNRNPGAVRNSRRIRPVRIAASATDDLLIPPGKRLEALSGDLQGFYSIRINNQWRIIFRWQQPQAHEVRIVDYH
ncbi:MAG: type II toxin-antitoxin system RelE/ParE family toxin [Candidatus Methylumidiphilus sp.]